MFRRLLAGLLGAALVTAAGLPDSTGQEKKEPPKKKERIAIADPEKAKADPDFADQGEYEGTAKTKDGKEVKFGGQVIAMGEGKYTTRLLTGGLPGAGWDGMNVLAGEGKRAPVGAGNAPPGLPEKGTVIFISNGKISFADAAGTTGTLSKVERKSPTLGQKPPEGAVVLFGKPGDEQKWDGGKLVELSDGKFLGVGEKSKKTFGAFKAHIEFRLPWMPNSTGQGRGNSGVYLQDRYECQVLDSFGLKGENNECGGIYTQHKPKVNMCLPPLAWQTYDIYFLPAQFDGDGKKTKNARVTVRHNGVLIHDDVELPKETPGGQKEAASPGPFQLQNHGDPVVYRNIWVVEVK